MCPTVVVQDVAAGRRCVVVVGNDVVVTLWRDGKVSVARSEKVGQDAR